MKKLFLCGRVFAVAALLIFVGCDKDSSSGGDGGEPGFEILSSNLSGPGSGFAYGYTEWMGDNTIVNGPSGANREWSFPDHNWMFRVTVDYVAPESTTCASCFPAADRARMVDGYPYYHYESIRPDGCYELGELTPSDTVFHLEPRLLIRLPLSVGTEWTDVMYWIDEYGAEDSSYSIDSFSYRADAWGTVITPYDSSTCIRVFIHEQNLYHPAGGETALEYEHYSYAWYDQNGNPVVRTLSSIYVEPSPDFNAGRVIMRIPQAIVSQQNLSARPRNGAKDIWGNSWRSHQE